MSELEGIVRDLLIFTNPDITEEVLEGLVGSVLNGNMRLILEDGKTTFSITQKGIDYVEAMPFQNIGESQT